LLPLGSGAIGVEVAEASEEDEAAERDAGSVQLELRDDATDDHIDRTRR
jgi:hypothetical protein